MSVGLDAGKLVNFLDKYETGTRLNPSKKGAGLTTMRSSRGGYVKKFDPKRTDKPLEVQVSETVKLVIDRIREVLPKASLSHKFAICSHFTDKFGHLNSDANSFKNELRHKVDAAIRPSRRPLGRLPSHVVREGGVPHASKKSLLSRFMDTSKS